MIEGRRLLYYGNFLSDARHCLLYDTSIKAMKTLENFELPNGLAR